MLSVPRPKFLDEVATVEKLLILKTTYSHIVGVGPTRIMHNAEGALLKLIVECG